MKIIFKNVGVKDKYRTIIGIKAIIAVCNFVSPNKIVSINGIIKPNILFLFLQRYICNTINSAKNKIENII